MSPNDKSKPTATTTHKPSNDKTGPTRQVVTPTSGKPTPTPTKPPAPEPDDDAGDDENGNGDDAKPSKKLTWREDKIARLKRNVSRARWFAGIVEANAKEAKIDSGLAELMVKRIGDAAAVVEAEMSKFIEAIPADFKGANAPGGRIVTGERKGTLKAGQRVALKPDALKRFSDLFTADELSSLEVLDVKGANVVLKTGTGTKLAIAARQIANDEAVTTDAAKKAS